MSVGRLGIDINHKNFFDAIMWLTEIFYRLPPVRESTRFPA